MRTVTVDVRVLHHARDTVGESPLWDAGRGVLWWVDTVGQQIRRMDWLSGAVESVEVPLPPAALFLDAAGLLVAAGIGWHRLDRGTLQPVAQAPVAVGVWRMNDGCNDTAGRVWTGSIPEPRGSGAGGDLFRLGPNGAVRVLGGLGVQNGAAVSPCGRRFYRADTSPNSRSIWTDPRHRAPRRGASRLRGTRARLSPARSAPGGGRTGSNQKLTQGRKRP